MLATPGYSGGFCAGVTRRILLQIDGFIGDWHSGKCSKARLDLSLLDVGLSTLVLDLVQRGMLDDGLIVVWGELGRTPGSNASVGRDHWSPTDCVWLSGGGIQTGQVVGATDPHGVEPTDPPRSVPQNFHNALPSVGTGFPSIGA